MRFIGISEAGVGDSCPTATAVNYIRANQLCLLPRLIGNPALFFELNLFLVFLAAMIGYIKPRTFEKETGTGGY